MPNLAIIPARGGSKRIPRKNIRHFLGKPIIAYSIEAAVKSGLFEEIMVSTDDPEIAEIAGNYGAIIPFFRSETNSDDFATTVDVIIEVLENYNTLGRTFEAVCCLYPTAPLISKKRIIQGYKKLIKDKNDVVFPVVPFSYPVWRGLRRMKSGRTEMVWKKYLNSRSQDLEEIYHDAGQWYWFLPTTIEKKRKIFTTNSSSVVLDPLEVQDIDNVKDWKIAELKYEFLRSIKYTGV